MLRRIEVDHGEGWKGVFREMYKSSSAARTADRWSNEFWNYTPAPNERITPKSDVYKVLAGTEFYYTDEGWGGVIATAFRYFAKEMCKAGVKVRIVALNDDHGLDSPYSDRKQVAVIPLAH